jgi:hypothetical protein
LSKPKDYPSLNGGGQVGVVQSSEEALASLVEELKEVISAPVYEGTPLRSVAERFWAALAEAQKTQAKKEERLEQNLAKLKGEFLLARAVSSDLCYLFDLCRKSESHSLFVAATGMGGETYGISRTSGYVQGEVCCCQGCQYDKCRELHGTGSFRCSETEGIQGREQRI